MKKLLMILLLAVAAYNSASAEVHDTYKSALSASRLDKKPMVVIIGASWCPPCRTMKDMIKKNPSVSDGGHIVIIDYKSAEAKELYKGSSVPALIRFHWNGDRWVKTTKLGGQTYSQLKRFLLGGSKMMPFKQLLKGVRHG